MGSKGNAVRGLDDDARNAVAAPATVSGEPPADFATGRFIPGKVAGDSDPRVRRSATRNGHARARRAGCPGELSPVVSRSHTGEGGPAINQNRGDGDVFRRRGVTCCLSVFWPASGAGVAYCLQCSPPFWRLRLWRRQYEPRRRPRRQWIKQRKRKRRQKTLFRRFVFPATGRSIEAKSETLIAAPRVPRLPIPCVHRRFRGTSQDRILARSREFR